VAKENAVANGVGSAVRVVTAEGVHSRAIRRPAPFDLVCANILAPPLIGMASEVARVIAPGGRLVLSGFLVTQGGAVLAAYRGHRLRLVRRIVQDGWLTLILAH
jgi:ribosomal protein L11 methyltransferase